MVATMPVLPFRWKDHWVLLQIRLKRAFVPPDNNDGCRVLVDRLWPRGVSKVEARIEKWYREIAPSDELRKWYNHLPERWPEFRRRYFAELAEKAEPVNDLLEKAQRGVVTLVYGARDEERNNAVALKEYLENWPGR